MLVLIKQPYNLSSVYNYSGNSLLEFDNEERSRWNTS
jgi:hypothetical protein